MNRKNKKKQDPFFWILLSFLLLMNSKKVAGQNIEENKIEISIFPSIKSRSTLMNVFNFEFIRRNASIEYDYERSYQILEIGPTLKLGNNISFSFTPYFRYGYQYSFYSNNMRGESRGVGFDFDFNIIKKINQERKRVIPNHVMLGYGVQNIGKKYITTIDAQNVAIKLENNTIDSGFGYTSKNNKFVYDIGIHYLQNGILNNREDKFLCYSFTFRYNLWQKPLFRDQAKVVE